MYVLITEKDGELNALLLTSDSKISDVIEEIKKADKYAIKTAFISPSVYEKKYDLNSALIDFRTCGITDGATFDFTDKQKESIEKLIEACNEMVKHI